MTTLEEHLGNDDISDEEIHQKITDRIKRITFSEGFHKQFPSWRMDGHNYKREYITELITNIEISNVQKYAFDAQLATYALKKQLPASYDEYVEHIAKLYYYQIESLFDITFNESYIGGIDSRTKLDFFNGYNKHIK